MVFPNVTGIVAEYNPFHNGHAYQLAKARELTDAEALTVVLSADFVQRGEPAMLSMHERAKTAVQCGADLVIELPAIFSCHNAGVFANSAVNLLSATGIVANISFGMEDTGWDLLSTADIVIKESNSFKTLLKKNLEKGYSFAEARINALDFCMPGAGKILQGANNSLALNYAAAVVKNHPEIKLVPVQRAAVSHDELTPCGKFASASAIRALAKENRFNEAKHFLPDCSAETVEKNLQNGTAYISDKKLWAVLRTLLLRNSAEETAACGELSEGIENKFKYEALSAKSFEEWLERCTSRRYPKGRIRRQAMQLLIGIDRWTNRAAQRLGVPYIRVLAMNATGRQLLKTMKETATLPIITKCGDAKFSSYAETIMRYDMLASELRLGFLSAGRTGSAHTEKPYMELD